MEDSSFPEVDPSKDLVTIIPHHGSSLHAVVPQDLPSPQQGHCHRHPFSRLQDPPAHSSTRGLLAGMCQDPHLSLPPAGQPRGLRRVRDPLAGVPRYQDAAVATAAGNGRIQEVFLPDLGFSPLPFLPTLPPLLSLSPRVSSSRAAECSDITMSLY